MNQHDFFINSVKEAKQVDDAVLSVYQSLNPTSTHALFDRWNLLPDPDTSPPKSEAGLTDLFLEIRATVDTEAQIVKAVFPNPPVVMQVFLQRVFAQSVRLASFNQRTLC